MQVTKEEYVAFLRTMKILEAFVNDDLMQANARIKGEIQQAFAEKRRYSNRARTSYDVSFEYDPDRNKAWYSEEYKGCGNGHYYIAIDANTALFCEDD